MKIYKSSFICFVLLFLVGLAGYIFTNSISLGIATIIFFVIIIVATMSICKHGFISSEERYLAATENQRQLIRDTVDTTMRIVVEEFKKEVERKGKEKGDSQKENSKRSVRGDMNKMTMVGFYIIGGIFLCSVIVAVILFIFTQAIEFIFISGLLSIMSFYFIVCAINEHEILWRQQRGKEIDGDSKIVEKNIIQDRLNAI